MERRRFSISVMTSWAVGSVLVIALAIFLVVGLRAGRVSSRRRMVRNNRALLSLAADMMFDPLYELDIWTLENMLNDLVGEADIVRAVVRDADGEDVAQVVAEGDALALEKQVSPELADQALAQRDVVQQVGGDYLVLCGPIATSTEQIGTLGIVVDLEQFNASFTPMIATMVTTVFVIVAGGVLVIVLLARRATSVADMLIMSADQIGRGNLDIQVPVRGPSETAELGEALDRMRVALKGLYADLEQQAEAQERRARDLQVAAEVAHRAAVTLDLPTLLRRVVALIDRRFDFTRQGIFLVDDAGEWAVLHAASGEAVRDTLERDFRLRVGEEGAVGQVAETGETYVVQDVTEDPVYVSDTNVIDIHSEVALPLKARGEVIGVLSVQSAEMDAFGESDLAALQILADQVALAISNARLFQQAEENLERARRAYGELSREAWIKLLRTQPEFGYYCDTNGVFAAADRPGDEELPEFSIPVTVRDQVVGQVKAHKPEDGGDWTQEEEALIEALVDQLGVALESARLYQSTQRRAARERLTREITDEMRRASTVEGIVQTALDELHKALGTSRTFVRLGSENASQQDGNGASD